MNWALIVLLLKLSALASIDFYMTVFGMGLVVRFGGFDGIPAFLLPMAHPGVMFVFGLLYVLEHFAEKIPGAAVVWNWIHVPIKPLSIAFFVAIVTFDIGVPILVIGVSLAFALSLVLSLLDAKVWTFLGLIPGVPIFVTLVEDVVIFILLLKTVVPLTAAAL